MVCGGTGQRPDGGSEAAREQRESLVAAFTKEATEHGYARLDVGRMLRVVGISQAVFDAHFESKEQVLLAAQDDFLDRLWLDTIGACEIPGSWPSKVRAVVSAVLSTLAEVGALARFFAIEAKAASLAVVERQFAALDRYAKLLRDGRRIYPSAASLPEATERALVGGIASLLYDQLLVEDLDAIPAMEGEIVEILLIPYVGEVEARRVAAA